MNSKYLILQKCQLLHFYYIVSALKGWASLSMCVCLSYTHRHTHTHILIQKMFAEKGSQS